MDKIRSSKNDHQKDLPVAVTIVNMSSNINIAKICVFCGGRFIVKTTLLSIALAPILKRRIRIGNGREIKKVGIIVNFCQPKPLVFI